MVPRGPGLGITGACLPLSPSLLHQEPGGEGFGLQMRKPTGEG